MAKKGKGLSPEELVIFNENEAFWGGDYFAYIKTLTSPKDAELAQLRRRFQSSFQTVGEDTYTFKFTFSQPDEVPSDIPCELVLQLTADDRFPQHCAVQVCNEGLRDNVRRGVQRALTDTCDQLGSFWRVIRALDAHIEEMYEKAMKPREEVEAYEPPAREEEKGEETKEETKEEVHMSDLPTISSDPSKPRTSRAPVVTFRATTQFILLRSVGSATCTGLTVAVNCSRCKQLIDLDLAVDANPETFTGNSECPNCHQVTLLDFRTQILHENNTENLGEVKCQGCIPLRVVYLTYRLTCVGCGGDTGSNALGILEKFSGNCSECQGKLAFSVGQVEFTCDAPEEKSHKQKKHKPQIVLGQPLPMNGVCKHYKQSYRWFRFRCCQGVFPCDKCHEELTEPHEYDRAEFMLCGFCSTEQKIGSIVTCVKCKAAVMSAAAGEKKFWEGGKGCRNPTLMSKNDRRKHRK